jgi:glycosyltransferase involved in cell wall biosynthesis
MPKLGVAIIIKNEMSILEKFVVENNLHKLFVEVIFLDDYSSDGTYEYLVDQGFAVHRRHLKFNFSAQRNHVASLMTAMTAPYICRIDIDEIMSSELQKYILGFSGDKDFYLVKRHEYTDGTYRSITDTPFIYRNCDEIKWVGTIHECIVGHKSTEMIPDGCILIHDKTTAQHKKSTTFYWENFEEHRSIVSGKK